MLRLELNVVNTGMAAKIVGFQPGHDVSYCILENGLPVLVEELERVTRRKMELGDGLKFFFSRYNDTQDVQYFTFANIKGRSGKRQIITKGAKSEARMNKILSKNDGRFFEFGHHLSHAANAFYTSGFDKSLIVTIDGGGWEDDSLRTAFAVCEGSGLKINKIRVFPISEVNLGGIWHDLTKYVFGLSVGYPKGDQAGTVMAMAALGEAKYTDLLSDYRKNLEKLKSTSGKSEQEKFNVAASLQKYTETVFRSTVSKYIPGHTNLCVSGGVSLNCVMLGKIKKWFPEIRNIFCDPIPYDAGVALGSARYLWHHVLGNPRINKFAPDGVKNNIRNMSPYLGKSYSKEDVKNACKRYADKILIKETEDYEVLQKIQEQKIISIYGGRSETGRRALGNRSIVADPRNKAMKATINEKVKHREWFRPFAPSILKEKVGEWFEDPILSPYMSFAIKFKSDKKNKVPAVVHFDGTGRLQTVNKQLSPWFHTFLTKWETLSGVPILVNTSFNDSEPIVETPEDALRCFLKTGIDYLYFFDYGYLVAKA